MAPSIQRRPSQHSLPRQGITRTGLKRFFKGWRGPLNKEIKAVSEMVVSASAREYERKAVERLERQTQKIESEKELVVEVMKTVRKAMVRASMESLREGWGEPSPAMLREAEEIATDAVYKVGTRFALDAVGEFNPEKRRRVRDAMRRIRRNIQDAQKGQKISIRAVEIASKDITIELGRRRALIFSIALKRTTKRLNQRLTKNLKGMLSRPF